MPIARILCRMTSLRAEGTPPEMELIREGTKEDRKELHEELRGTALRLAREAVEELGRR